MPQYYQYGEPNDSGMLSVGDGNQIYWETSGNLQGKPAVVLHGGPGQGCSPNMRMAFNPDLYRVVMFDQRGCGRSAPHASDPQTDMRFNTTHHLMADMEKLREHLKIERWLVSGASWGSTLALAYSQQFPQRVTEIVLAAVTTSTRTENQWLYRDASLFFPEEYEQFRRGAPGADRQTDLIAAYARLMESSDLTIRKNAAVSWCAWEDAVVSLEPGANPKLYSAVPLADLLAFVRICTHYAAHGAWLEEGQLQHNAGRLVGIPGVIIHGRQDLSCPLRIPWELARVWTTAELIALADSGHQRSDSKRDHSIRVLDQFASKNIRNALSAAP